MGRHHNRAPVFADEHGHRARAVTLLVRGSTIVLSAGLAGVALSLLSGVSLPGVAPPARLPADERPVRHADSTGARNADAPRESPALPLWPSPLDGSPGLTTATPGSGSTTPGASRTPSSTSTSPGLSSSAAASTHGNRPTSTPTSTSHGRAPVTPPGHTKHP